MQKICFVLGLILCAACSIDRTIEELSSEETKLFSEFQSLPASNKLKIVNDQEPGERLLLCVTIKKREDGLLVPNQQVHFYHTSTSGEYQPSNPQDESTARLNGVAISNAEGRMLIETILPGDYGSSSDNRHIHTTIKNAAPVGYDIHFKQYTGFMGKNFMDGSDQHFLADLKQLQDGSLITFVTIEVKNWKASH